MPWRLGDSVTNHERTATWSPDPADIGGSAAASAAGDQDLALVLAYVASDVMDTDDREAHEAAFLYEDTPLWETLRGHFDPIPLDSPLAEGSATLSWAVPS
jgi:hypothetical protein